MFSPTCPRSVFISRRSSNSTQLILPIQFDYDHPVFHRQQCTKSPPSGIPIIAPRPSLSDETGSTPPYQHFTNVSSSATHHLFHQIHTFLQCDFQCNAFPTSTRASPSSSLPWLTRHVAGAMIPSQDLPGFPSLRTSPHRAMTDNDMRPSPSVSLNHQPPSPLSTTSYGRPATVDGASRRPTYYPSPCHSRHVGCRRWMVHLPSPCPLPTFLRRKDVDLLVTHYIFHPYRRRVLNL